MESRLTDLEIKAGYTEDTLEEINRTLYRQQQEIDQLRQELKILRQQVQTSMPAEPRNLADEIPPHY